VDDRDDGQGPERERVLAAARAVTFDDLGPHLLPPTQVLLDVRPAVRELWDACHAASLALEDLPALLALVDGWVRWDRDVGLALAVGARLVMPEGLGHAAASVLVARALLHRNDDRWVTNLDHAVLLCRDLPRVAPEIELLLAARHAHLSDHLVPRRYADVTPVSAFPENLVAAAELFGRHPELGGDTEALRRFVCEVTDDALGATVAGGVLGDLLGSRGEHDGATAARTAALATAERHGITTRIGHLRRQLGNGLIRQGLDAGHAGDPSAREELLRRAASVLEAAVPFESAPGCEYWLTLTQYRLADAYRYLDDLEAASRAFDSGLDARARHLAVPGRFLDGAVKRVILESGAATAASFALGTGQLGLLLRQMAQDQSGTGAQLLAEMHAMHGLDDDMKEAVAGTRPEDYREAAAVRQGYQAYRTYMVERAAQRFRADTGRGWVSSGNAAEPSTPDAVRGLLAPCTTVLAVSSYQHLSIALAVGEAHPLVAVSRGWTSGTAAGLRHRLADASAQARDLPPALAQRLLQSAVEDIVEGCQAALGPFLDGMLPAEVERLLLVVPRQARELPWLALLVDDLPLLARAQVIHLESLGSLRAPSSDGRRPVAMVYDDIGAPGFEPLTVDPQAWAIDQVLRHPSREEVLALAPLLPSGDRTTALHAGGDPLQGHVLVDAPRLLGGEAVEVGPAAREPVVKSRDVLFACHAVFDPADPLGSGLDLPGWPERLKFSDVLSSMDVRGWGCVVLAACESGLAVRELPQEEPGVASAFLAGGVDHVVSTLWPVDQLATTWWLERFLHARGLGVPAAAQAASLGLRDLGAEELEAWALSLPAPVRAAAESRAATADRPFAHPFFWAPYVVSGTG
jgi:hypothetical protein